MKSRIDAYLALLLAVVLAFESGAMAQPQTSSPGAAAKSISNALTEREDAFQAPATSYALSSPPAGLVKVWLNGLRQCFACGDYSLSGAVITFHGIDTSSAGSIVVLADYWSAQ